MVGERPGQLDRRRGVLEYPDRLAEQGEAAVAALDQARGAQRDTQRPRPAVTAGHLERRPGQPPGLGLLAEQGVGDRRLRPPGIQAIDDPEPLASLAAGPGSPPAPPRLVPEPYAAGRAPSGRPRPRPCATSAAEPYAAVRRPRHPARRVR